MTDAKKRPIVLDEFRDDSDVLAFIEAADRQMAALGYTEHGVRHAGLIANIARQIMERLDYPQRTSELAEIAAYLHDTGNAVNRLNHAQSSAFICLRLLSDRHMDMDEVTRIMGAVGDHEDEETRNLVILSAISAAVILADKSDVHKSRVRSRPEDFDIHDRVNFAAEHSFLRVDARARTITLEITIDTAQVQVMEYFEIFLDRMVMCRRAARYLGCEFGLEINKIKLL